MRQLDPKAFSDLAAFRSCRFKAALMLTVLQEITFYAHFFLEDFEN